MGCTSSRDVQIKPDQIEVHNNDQITTQTTTIIVHRPTPTIDTIESIEPKQILKPHHSTHHSFQTPIPSDGTKPVLIRDASDSDCATSEDDDVEDLSVCEIHGGRPSDAAHAPISRSQSSQQPPHLYQARQSSNPPTAERHVITSNRTTNIQHVPITLHRSSISISPASPSSQHAHISSSLTPPIINEASSLAFPTHGHRASLTPSNLPTKRNVHAHNPSSGQHSLLNQRPSLSAHKSPLIVPGSPSRSTAVTSHEAERDPTQFALGSMPTTPRSIGVESPHSVSRVIEISTPSMTQMRLQRHGSKYRVVDIDALPESVYSAPMNHTPHLAGTPATATSSFTAVEPINTVPNRKSTEIHSLTVNLITPEPRTPVLRSSLSCAAKLTSDNSPSTSTYATRIRPGHKHAVSLDGRALDWNVSAGTVARRTILHQRTFSASHMQRSIDALAAAAASVATFPTVEDQSHASSSVPTVASHGLGSRKSSRRFTKSRHSSHFDGGELSVRVHSTDKGRIVADEPNSPPFVAPALLPDEPRSAKSVSMQEHGSLLTHSRKRSFSSRQQPSLKHFESSGVDAQNARVPRGALLLCSSPMATQLAGIAIHKIGLTSDIASSTLDALNKLRERPPAICLVDLSVKNSRQVLQAISNLNSEISTPVSPSSSVIASITSCIVTIAIVVDLSDATIQEAIHLGCSGCIEQGASLAIVLYDFLTHCKSRTSFIAVNSRLEFSSISVSDRISHHASSHAITEQRASLIA